MEKKRWIISGRDAVNAFEHDDARQRLDLAACFEDLMELPGKIPDSATALVPLNMEIS